MPRTRPFRVRLELPPEAAPIAKAFGEMLSNAAAEFIDDGLERVERDLVAPIASKVGEKLSRARQVAQKHRRRGKS